MGENSNYRHDFTSSLCSRGKLLVFLIRGSRTFKHEPGRSFRLVLMDFVGLEKSSTVSLIRKTCDYFKIKVFK